MKPKYINAIVKLAIAEDLGAGDITTDNLVPRNSKSKARLTAKAEGVVCGVNFAREVDITINSPVWQLPIKRQSPICSRSDLEMNAGVENDIQEPCHS